MGHRFATTRSTQPSGLLFVVLAAAVLVLLAQATQAASSPTASSDISGGSTASTVLRRPRELAFWSTVNVSGSSRASASDEHTFDWHFPTRNVSWLTAALHDITDPASARYGQWMQWDDIMAVMGPSVQAKETVQLWLQRSGVDSVQDLGDALTVTASVATVEAMFQTELHYHVNTLNGQQASLAVAGTARLPHTLVQYLGSLHGVYDYPMTVFNGNRQRVNLASGTSSTMPPAVPSLSSRRGGGGRFHPMQKEETNARCQNRSFWIANAAVSPQFLAAQYNYSSRATTRSRSASTAMVTAFNGQAFSQADLTHQQNNVGFAAEFTPSTVYNAADNRKNLAANGPGGEASLDIQALFSTSPTSNNSFYANKNTTTFLSTLTAIAALPADSRPQVVSFSYTFGVSDYEYAEGDSGRKSEVKLQQLAALGVTVIVASGDDGAQGMNINCNTSINSAGYGILTPFPSSPLLPMYPASSPWVLSVGESDFLAAASTLQQAEAAFSENIESPPLCDNCPTDQFNGYICQNRSLGVEPVSTTNRNEGSICTSGGGFASISPRPSWQQTAVSDYLQNKCSAAAGCTLPPSDYYNTSSRGYPDVTAYGGYYPITLDGMESIVQGTSIAAPIWAGIIARLNEASLARNNHTVGFVNPLLYTIAAAQPTAFTDVVQGNNLCAPDNTVDCRSKVNEGKNTSCSGYYAAPGWDPVSGLGSPNVGLIIDYILSM